MTANPGLGASRLAERTNAVAETVAQILKPTTIPCQQIALGYYFISHLSKYKLIGLAT